jgi:hypothetical protein
VVRLLNPRRWHSLASEHVHLFFDWHHLILRRGVLDQFHPRSLQALPLVSLRFEIFLGLDGVLDVVINADQTCSRFWW